MRRWLVTLALAVVALPTVADAGHLRIELASQKVTTSKSLAVAHGAPPRVAQLPASVELDAGAITITTPKHTFRHSLGRRDGLSWLVTVDTHVVIGFASRPGGTADTIAAFDHTTGRLAWRRSVDSLHAASLTDSLLAIERAGNLDIVDARTGHTLATTPLREQALQSISCPAAGDLHIKTRGDLIAIDRATGDIRWSQPTSSTSTPTITPTAILDAWIDRTNHRFGIASYDPRTGERLDSVDLGSTSGWYDVEHVTIAPDGANDVLVTAAFATE